MRSYNVIVQYPAIHSGTKWRVQNSYLLLDENTSFLECSQGGKVRWTFFPYSPMRFEGWTLCCHSSPFHFQGQSILTVVVEKALQQAGFYLTMFHQRGGVYNWRCEKETRNWKYQEKDVRFHGLMFAYFLLSGLEWGGAQGGGHSHKTCIITRFLLVSFGMYWHPMQKDFFVCWSRRGDVDKVTDQIIIIALT